MADTRPLAPTDAELMDLGHECELDAIAFGRAVLAKWGTPQPVVGVEPAQWQKRHQLRTNGEWENTNEHDAKWWRDNSQGWEIRALYTTPQPTQAQAGAVPLTDEQIESLLWKYGYDTDDTQMAAMLKEAHGIKGGQHGAE